MIERTFNDRYRLDDKIGEGGMAIVFSGTDTLLRRRVAIKVLRPQFAADEDFVQRFYSEARHAAKLSHPNVVNIYDVGQQGDTYFIVMELVEGATLAEMIETDHRLPEPVAINYAAQICNGLAYAHRQGLLHRDIKPANILVTKDDVVKLSDFGIARAISKQTMTVTQPGMVMGSVYYLSPEQAQGHEMQETSDLYSLGVVLYQMLTGELPYTGDSPITVAIKHVSGPVPTIDPNDDTISPALGAIVKRLLQKEPSFRFHSAMDVASALREAREHPSKALPFEVPGNGSGIDSATRAMGRITVPQPPPRRSKFPDKPRALDDQTRAINAEEVREGANARQWARVAQFTLAFIVLFASVFAGFRFVHGNVFASRAPVRIVNYIGMTQSTALAALTKLGLDAHATEVPSETTARGIVVSQHPAGGLTLPPGSAVELFVSSGLPIVEMTDLRSFSQEDAERYLRNAHLTPKFSEKYDTAPVGTVIGQSPDPGTRVPMHSLVYLTVSKGLSPVSVPDIVSLTLDDAVKMLQERKLDVNVADREPSDNIPENVVASQDSKPGSKVPPGTKINVVVSSGPASIVIPNVGGRGMEDAVSAMKSVGITPHIVYLAQAGTPTGTVLDQSPAASSSIRHGEAVTLTIAVPGTVPNITGMPLDQAEKALADAGYTVGNVAYTQEGTEGKVTRTEPEANAVLRPGEAVTIYYNAPAPR